MMFSTTTPSPGSYLPSAPPYKGGGLSGKQPYILPMPMPEISIYIRAMLMCLLLLCLTLPGCATGQGEGGKTGNLLSPLEVSEIQDSPDPLRIYSEISGQWDIHEKERSYKATIDQAGHATYTWQNGTFHFTSCDGRRCEGIWEQPGNDREGGFEVLFLENIQEGKGVWWYTRVGKKQNLPPRQFGGPYTWVRRTSPNEQLQASQPRTRKDGEQ